MVWKAPAVELPLLPAKPPSHAAIDGREVPEGQRKTLLLDLDNTLIASEGYDGQEVRAHSQVRECGCVCVCGLGGVPEVASLCVILGKPKLFFLVGCFLCVTATWDRA